VNKFPVLVSKNANEEPASQQERTADDGVRVVQWRNPRWSGEDQPRDLRAMPHQVVRQAEPRGSSNGSNAAAKERIASGDDAPAARD
jgi:hypothetical protein